MQNLMPPVNTSDGVFHDGDPSTGEMGTAVTAGHMNNLQSAMIDIQSEAIAVLNKAGVAPNSEKSDQLLSSLQKLLLTRENPFSDIAADGAAAISKALGNLGLGDISLAGVATGIISGSGYIKVPLVNNGSKLNFIIQWGYGTFPTQATTTVTLPITFPTSGLVAVACKGVSISLAGEYSVGAQANKSTILITNTQPSVNALQGINWIALGY